MAIWKEPSTTKIEPAPVSPTLVAKKEFDSRSEYSPPAEVPRRTSERDLKESLIAAGLTIEGKIEGAGDVRIAGRFKGDVHVQGNLTIDVGAKLTGSVRASAVTIGGELEGDIDDASRVELLATGVLSGNLKAGSLTVTAGSRMRGQVEFGWEDKIALKSKGPAESSIAS
jgi:cytoskeletal protein CcmA (bactofilin family)